MIGEFLERTAAARYASSVFYEEFNDIDIYIEDTANGYEKLFAIILGRLLADRLTVTKVFPLGGRQKVIETARQAQNVERKSVYIIDGDLYLITGEREGIPNNVVTLDRYCIENYLIDERVIVDILDDEHPEKRKDDLAALFDFEHWLSSSRQKFTELFLLYAAAHHLQSGLPTISRPMKDLIRSNRAEVDAEKAQKIIEEIHSKLMEKFDEAQVTQLLAELQKNIDVNSCFVSKYVSAKDYTLPMLFVRMRSIWKLAATNLNIKMRLAKHCDLSSLQNVKAAIHVAIQ